MYDKERLNKDTAQYFSVFNTSSADNFFLAWPINFSSQLIQIWVPLFQENRLKNSN